MRRTLIASCFFLFAFSLLAQPKLELTVDTIMRGYGLEGWSPRAARWSRDGQWVYFEWKEYTDPVEAKYRTWVVGRDGKGLRKLSDEEEKNAPPRNASWTRDRKFAVSTDHGDVFLYDAVAKQRRALTQTNERESNPRFTKDAKHVAFVRGNNLFVVALGSGEVIQRTNIVEAGEKGPNVSLFEDPDKDKTASQKWVADEAAKLSDVLTRRAAERKADEAKRKAELALAPMKLKKGESIADLQLTPDEKYVVAFISVEGDNAKRTNVPSYVTESGYTTDIASRTKVGDVQEASRVATISTVDGKVRWLKTGLKKVEPAKKDEDKKSENTGTQEKTETTAEKTEVKEPAEREIELDSVQWSDDGSAAVLPVRASDNKDWWLLAFDPATATTRELVHDHDDAWINFDTFSGFVPESRTVWFMSERTGWQHLYTIPFEGGEPRAMTSGKYEVDDVQFSDDHKNFYLTTSRESLFEHHLDRLPVGGGAMTKLTTTAGWHDARISPDGAAYADVYSDSNKPWELFIGDAKGDAKGNTKGNTKGDTKITTSPAPEFFTYPWIDVPIVQFTARDGAEVPAHIYKPSNWKGGPAVIFVHGAGYLQNVQKAWSYYSREFMFHHLLMERGYLVLDVDYRASQGYGRDWRTAIYRHMGGKDLDDQVDAAKWLAREQGVDPKRIGIYGGSYGGFITLMAMFTTPDVFAAGAALRPVTDWAHYNHGYTSNILNTPQGDPEAYRQSSPIYFAEGLKGALLICHGMIDTNVHYQDTVRLAQRLIELRKENWEVAGYPLEDHGFVEPTSWADEYKRILRLFERELK
jgi:dipeptidyl aminopeptidase/acylaminoacyl peptidase